MSSVPTAMSDLFFSYAPGLEGGDSNLYDNSGEPTEILKEAANLFLSSLSTLFDVNQLGVTETDLVNDFMERL